MKIVTTDRLLRTISFLCIAAVGFALFSQYVLQMAPCAWCVLQRLILLAIAAVCGLAGTGWGSRLVHRLGAILTLVLSVLGMLAAWYQYSVASASFSCAQTLADRLISGSGLDASMPWLFGIYASCMDARVELLGIEYALWGMIVFALCAVLALWVWAHDKNT